MTPYRVAFDDGSEDYEWFVADTVVDGIFFLDVIQNCFLAYYDKDNNIVVEHWKIFMNYLKG